MINYTSGNKKNVFILLPNELSLRIVLH